MKIAGKFWILKACILSVMSISLLSSCTPGKHPFLMIQLCLESDSGVDLFKSELQQVAREEGMLYIDGSIDTERNLKTLGVLKHPEGKLLHLGVDADGGPSLIAGNLGLNTYDVAVGFGDHSGQSDRAFAERVLARLRQHWKLKVVPEGSGAFPDPQCIGATGAQPNSSFKPTPLRGAA